MKNRLWLFQIPVILFFTAAFWITQQGVEGDLSNSFFREKVFPHLRRFSSVYLDLKFHARGPQEPKNKIVILEVDSPAIAEIGRWPWHRDQWAKLIHKLMPLEPKAIGFDIVFSEQDQVKNLMTSGFLKLLNSPTAQKLYEDHFDGDAKFTQALAQVRGEKTKVVLGWMLEGSCQPGLDGIKKCQLDDPARQAQLLQLEADGSRLTGLQAFSVPASAIQGTPINWEKTPLITGISPITNFGEFQFVGEQAGLLNTIPDPDGVLRRATLLQVFENKLYPTIALEMARAALGEEYALQTSPENKITSLKFKNSNQALPISPIAGVTFNFRGPARTFKYVPILNVLNADLIEQKITTETFRGPASESLRDVFRDAYVLIGVSAVGVYDMRAFPFDSNVPGVEGHATILDNILSNDFLSLGGVKQETYAWIMLLLMLSMGIAFAFATDKLEAIPALLVGTTVIASLGFIDIKVLFSRNVHWDFSFLYFELGMVFVLTNAARYVLEERNKKFIKGAFSKYVAPTIVDSILKDPTKLSVGGERRDLTILFSDIRGFTTMSETMEPKALAGFLNDYLGIMTDVVFDTDGTLDKYIGDAVMAFWGAPLDQPQHAANAARAARIMMQRLAENRERFRQQYGVEVNIGIGINSGPVNVGNMGSERIFEYTVIGDHVNLASRLEGLTKEYSSGILTTRFTLDAIANAGQSLPPHRTLDFVQVKGKNEAVELIQIFEGEPDHEGLKLFDEARRLYTQRHWDQAIALFNQANEKLKGNSEEDGPSQIYIERCNHYRSNPPESSWDGRWKMTTK